MTTTRCANTKWSIIVWVESEGGSVFVCSAAPLSSRDPSVASCDLIERHEQESGSSFDGFTIDCDVIER